MKIALITLSDEGANIVNRLYRSLDNSQIFLHEKVAESFGGRRFKSIITLTGQIFERYDGLVYVVPCGVAVRALSAQIKNKKTDPGVVVVDAAGRFAVSLLSGHEGEANNLAIAVCNIIGAEPVITTTTEALKTVIAGIGCRRGAKAEAIIAAIDKALELVSVERNQIRLLASADIKMQEEGLLAAAQMLQIPVRFISSEEIRSSGRKFDRSDFVKTKVNLPAVAEPAALLAGRRTKLILPKMKLGGVTVALARENYLSSASGREAS